MRDERNYYFWWSDSLDKIDAEEVAIGEEVFRNFCLIGSQIKEYNLMSPDKNHGCSRDDLVFLGIGKYSHNEIY